MNKEAILKQYDNLIKTTDWIKERNQPVALTLIETLEPASGADSIIFPPTFAFKDDAAKRRGSHPYPISNLMRPADGSEVQMLSAQEAQQKGIESNICDLDTVGSQSNRMEPIFKRKPLSSLVPQIVIKAKDSRVNLLDVGHRVADGATRFSGDFGEKAAAAIAKLHKEHLATDLARLAPTSLVFGFWDSRGMQAKAARILCSTIRATNVSVARRSAQYSPPFDIEELSQLGSLGADIETAKAAIAEGSGDDKNPLSKQGLLPAPATDSHGGVRVYGSIIRRTEINLVALRALRAATDDESLRLRRYLLGLALVAATCQASYDLRQGCLLVLKQGKHGSGFESQMVLPSGKRDEFAWVFEEALEYATEAAKDFGIWADEPTEQESEFQTEKVLAALKGDEEKKAAKAAAKPSAKKK
jgi:CRISPR-associated protein Csb1